MDRAGLIEPVADTGGTTMREDDADLKPSRSTARAHISWAAAELVRPEAYVLTSQRVRFRAGRLGMGLTFRWG